ncbi:hypothetical protein NDU88_000231 [Pleurodeles waltl]|uniref:Uncharacterized protein n=1 Tax=Pleurodeles waltl TaxID=8319 RepID=A0AAV7Q0M2_PLEWA|nr:hypothetical protein NDU88_000231 [Pleurodeles waltl]
MTCCQRPGEGETDDGMHVARLVDLVGFGLCAQTPLSDMGRTRGGTGQPTRCQERKLICKIRGRGRVLNAEPCPDWKTLKK